MPARLRLSWGMKTLKLFLLSVLECLEFGWQAIRYALILVSAFFRQRASLGCEMVAMRSQLTFYKESIRQQRQPRPRFRPAFRLLWVLLSRVWTGWKSAAELMKPKTVLQWHEHAFLQWWRWKSRRKGGRPTIRQEMRALIRRLSRENVLWSAETIHGHLHGAYSWLSNPVHLCDLESFPSPDRAFCCDGASHDGLGDPATAGSDAFWSTTKLFVPRQRRNLRRRGGPVSRGNWDCRSQNGPPVPLAKSIRGKVWRYPTARAVGSRDCP